MFRELAKDIEKVEFHPAKAVLINKGVQALISYRLANRLWRLKIPLIPLILTRISQILYGIDISYKAQIDAGCHIIHGYGLVIGDGVKVGENATFFHGVTLGIKCTGFKEDGFPELGDNVFVGCGAKILGPISIGDNVKIGANAVVLNDVPSNSTAVGIPARVKKKARKFRVIS